RPCLAVLPGIAVIGEHGRDAPGRSPPECVNADQQFDQIVVGGTGGRLHDEYIGATNILVNLGIDLRIRETPDIGRNRFYAKLGANPQRKGTVSITSQYLHQIAPQVILAYLIQYAGGSQNQHIEICWCHLAYKPIWTHDLVKSR